MRYLLTGDSFDAATAKNLNIVTEVTELGQEFARALEIATRIADQAPLAVQATLASARNEDRYQQEKANLMKRLGALMVTKDVQRGMQAFATKTKAEFKGD